MTLASSSDRAISVGILLCAAVGWATILATSASLGEVAYAAPLVVIISGLAGIALLHAMQGRGYATACLLAFVVLALNLNFRQREIGVTGLDFQSGLKFATWLALIAIALARWRQIAFLIREPILGLAFAYGCVSLASSAWSIVPAYTGASAIGIFAYIALSCIAIIDLGANNALRVMVWTLAVYLLVGVVAGVVAPEAAWLPPSVEENVYRLQGLAGHPNVFGQQIGVFITLAIIARRLRCLQRLTYLAFLTLGFMALLATGSRTTLIAVAIAWSFIAVRERGYGAPLTFAMLGGVAILLLVSAVVGMADVGSLLQGLSRTGTTSEIFTLTGRTEVWDLVWRFFLQKPLLGWGFNGTEGLLSNNVSASFVGSAVNAHNMFLQSLLSIGILGSLPGFGSIALLIARFFLSPDPARDQFAVFMLIVGLGEVEIFASPVLLTLAVFFFLARDASGGSARRLASSDNAGKTLVIAPEGAHP
ncbi:O-antigen ligase family protein [Microvirga terricola]|uniref:O-antigen ligase family protein n=1 Tax=Microvirga terricola TaxID=2719797 RepID=A0ABX0VAV0_9HYPH|nr:O-antigen ligase family protein [Microvirga terricola]NIX76191.1 O-antigen ligase family protein [Microvirga terricola]